MVVIYKLNFPNGKTYIGQTRQKLQVRLNRHKSNAFNKNSRMYNLAISNAIRKYGWDNIKVNIIDKTDIDHAIAKEAFYIEKFESMIDDNGYNLVKEGQIRKEISNTTRQKMSNSHKDVPLSKKHRENILKAKQGKLPSNTRSVVQYDLNGNIIKEYESVSEILRGDYSRAVYNALTHENIYKKSIWKYV